MVVRVDSKKCTAAGACEQYEAIDDRPSGPVRSRTRPGISDSLGALAIAGIPIRNLRFCASEFIPKAELHHPRVRELGGVLAENRRPAEGQIFLISDITRT